MRCRNKIHLLKHPNALQRPSTGTNINPSPLPLARLKGTPTLSRAEFDAVAPKLFPSPATLQEASAQDSPVPAPKALVVTKEAGTKASPSPAVRKARSNTSASTLSSTTSASTVLSPLSESANVNIKYPQPSSVISSDQQASTPASSPDTSCCSICLDSLFTDPQRPIRAIAACGHAFHSHCLQKWLQRYQPRCPLCQRWLAGRSTNDASDHVVVNRQRREDGVGARAVEEGRAGERGRTRTRWHARWF